MCKSFMPIDPLCMPWPWCYTHLPAAQPGLHRDQKTVPELSRNGIPGHTRNPSETVLGSDVTRLGIRRDSAENLPVPIQEETGSLAKQHISRRHTWFQPKYTAQL